MNKSASLAAACLAAIMIAWSGPAVWSQTRTIKIVVPYTPGSGPDIISRLMADEIGRGQGPSMVVENRPGGGTVIGTEAVARAAPDGNTVLLVANAFVVNPALKKGNYDPTTSFEPVCELAATPIVLVVNGDSPYRTVADLIAAARAKPGQLSLASGGPATSLHVAFEVLKRAANIDMTYVPYGGSGPAINTLMGGHVTSVFADYPTVVEQLKSGRLRALLTTARTRPEPLPDVPTLAETGISPYEADIFYGVMAPAKTPPEQLAQLIGWFTGAMKGDGMKARLGAQGLYPALRCGPEFGAYLRKQVEDYTRVVRESNIKAE